MRTIWILVTGVVFGLSNSVAAAQTGTITGVVVTRGESADPGPTRQVLLSTSLPFISHAPRLAAFDRGHSMVDWRRITVYTYRWLGIAGGLLFLAWFVFGIVLMCVWMPSLTRDERLARLAALDLATANVTPAEAARTADLSTQRVLVGMRRCNGPAV